MDKVSKKVICMYLRLSGEDDDIRYNKSKYESNSITAQREIIHRYIQEREEFNDYDVIEKYDDGFSGTKFDNRPAFQEMIELAKMGKINCIIVKDLSRFGRDYIELGDYMEQLLPFLRIRLISINDNYDSDKMQTGGLDVFFKNLVYDYYAREASNKARLTWKNVAEKGTYRCSAVLYGYKKSPDNKRKLIIDDDAAPIVREIFEMKIAGKNPTQIAKVLNDRKILCPVEYRKYKVVKFENEELIRKCFWDNSTVDRIIHNEKYVGNMVTLRTRVNKINGIKQARPEEEWIRVENTHEAIVSKEMYEAANAGRKKVKRKASCTRNIYYCSKCGRKMVYRGGTRLKCKTGYRLDDSHKCGIESIMGCDADRIILEDIKYKMSTFIESDCTNEVNARESVKLEALVRGLTELDNEWKSKYADYADRKITKDEYLEYVHNYKQIKAQLENEKQLAEDNAMDQETLNRKQRVKEKFSLLLGNDYLTEELKEVFIEKVLVYPNNRFEIVWKFDVQQYFGYSKITDIFLDNF